MPSFFNSSRRKARRAIIAEADARGVKVQDLRSILSVKELAEIIDNAAPHLDLAPWGLAPRATLDDRPSSGVPAVEAAVSAAVVGDWQPAAELLVESYGDWDLRACAVQALASTAANDDGWLVAWRTARPDDGHAAVVDCAARTALAWQLRGGERARETTPKQFDDFHRVLTDAEAAAEQATLAMPRRPDAMGHPGHDRQRTVVRPRRVRPGLAGARRTSTVAPPRPPVRVAVLVRQVERLA